MVHAANTIVFAALPGFFVEEVRDQAYQALSGSDETPFGPQAEEDQRSFAGGVTRGKIQDRGEMVQPILQIGGGGKKPIPSLVRGGWSKQGGCYRDLVDSRCYFGVHCKTSRRTLPAARGPSGRKKTNGLSPGSGGTGICSRLSVFLGNGSEEALFVERDFPAKL